MKKLSKIIFTLILALILVCFVFTISNPAEVDIQTPQPPQTVDISLLAVGDNLIHGPIYRQAQARAGGSGYDFAFAYQQIEPYLQNVDFACINQETPLGGEELGVSSYPNFNSPQELGDHMVAIGFNLISHANNHVLDKGTQGFFNTIEYWQGQADAVMAGIYPDSTAAEQLRIVEKDGVRIAFLAYTYGTNGISLPASSAGVVNYIDKEKILADVAKAEAAADITIVSIHWGNEYQMTPSSEQTNLAEALANAGVEIVFGSHPHVIQQVTSLTQPDGSPTVIFYSLGNFISAQNRADTMLGGMASLDLTYNLDNGELIYNNVKFIPIITQYGSSYADVHIVPFKDYTPELAAQHGVRARDSAFSYDYIRNLITSTVHEKYLDFSL